MCASLEILISWEIWNDDWRAELPANRVVMNKGRFQVKSDIKHRSNRRTNGRAVRNILAWVDRGFKITPLLEPLHFCEWPSSWCLAEIQISSYVQQYLVLRRRYTRGVRGIADILLKKTHIFLYFFFNHDHFRCFHCKRTKIIGWRKR